MKLPAFIFLLMLSGVRVAAAPPPAGPLADAWQTLANYRPREAVTGFEQLEARGDGDARSVRFGLALGLLAQPSTVPDRVARAQSILSALAAGGTDELALGAQFYLARLAEFQADPPDPVRAAGIFERLIAEHPASVWAQAAVPRLAILLLYTSAGPAEPAKKLAEAEHLLAAASDSRAAVELRLVIADAIFYHRLPDEQALPHLLAAERLGGLDAATRADVLVQIGKLSRLVRQPVQAARYYEMFLSAYPRDSRQYAIRQELAAVTGGKPAP